MVKAYHLCIFLVCIHNIPNETFESSEAFLLIADLGMHKFATCLKYFAFLDNPVYVLIYTVQLTCSKLLWVRT